MEPLPAKPTRYGGILFRSRLEARVAEAMTFHGIEWTYEPQGFDLDGVWYLPDFYCPRIRTWVEVKGPPIEPIDAVKVTALGRRSNDHQVLVIQAVPIDQALCWSDPLEASVMRGARQTEFLINYFGLGWAGQAPSFWAWLWGVAVLAKCQWCGQFSWQRVAGKHACRACGRAGRFRDDRRIHLDWFADGFLEAEHLADAFDALIYGKPAPSNGTALIGVLMRLYMRRHLTIPAPDRSPWVRSRGEWWQDGARPAGKGK